MKDLENVFGEELKKYIESKLITNVEGNVVHVSGIPSEKDLNGFVKQFIAEHNVTEAELELALEAK